MTEAFGRGANSKKRRERKGRERKGRGKGEKRKEEGTVCLPVHNVGSPEMPTDLRFKISDPFVIVSQILKRGRRMQRWRRWHIVTAKTSTTTTTCTTTINR
jgi:hypothetical protein